MPSPVTRSMSGLRRCCRQKAPLPRQKKHFGFRIEYNLVYRFEGYGVIVDVNKLGKCIARRCSFIFRLRQRLFHLLPSAALRRQGCDFRRPLQRLSRYPPSRTCAAKRLRRRAFRQPLQAFSVSATSQPVMLPPSCISSKS